MIEADTQESADRRRRRSRNRNRAQRVRDLEAYLGSPVFGKRLFIGMCVLALVYCLNVLMQVRDSSMFYNSLMVGMTDNEARYMLGSPKAADETAGLWTYNEDGRAVNVRFNAAKRVASIDCAATSEGRFSCPGMMDIRIGTTEDRIWLKLGKPDREVYAGNDKTIYYDDMGMVFRLRRFMVVGMELRDSATLLSFIPYGLRALVP